ncbi:glycosyltransferase family 2 protein [Candidatus Roizmanbacteria bacterium]|nr:glycosyltransferase family 2 protein [Candidatus Roizmanbacteria bacterium]
MKSKNTISHRSSIFVVMPACNEEKIIKKVIESVQKQGYENIIVVDDGSSDDTGEKALETQVLVLRHSINRGKGAAVKTGIEAAKKLNASAVVTMDSDGQHNPKDIAPMVEYIENGYDVVLGSRLLKSKGMPFIKIIANYLGNFFTWIIYGLWVTDSQSGFRAYSKRAIAEIDTKHDRYEYDSEVIREIVKNKLRFIEIPVQVRYSKYSMNKVQKQSFYTGIKTLVRLVLSS